MRKRYLIVALALALAPALPASAQFSVNIGGAGFNIGINMPVYPTLVRIPGYPVYYDPNVNSNYFFYDGLYWVFSGDNWYASTWYNGPWDLVPPEAVPQFVLLIPVRYYRAPPIYFRSWYRDAPPRWGEHWGRSWEQRRVGWDHWDRHSAPAAAPLPVYQRQYSGSHYPRAVEQQQVIQSQNYRYQPRDAVAQQHFRQHAGGGQPQGPARVQTVPTMQQGQSPQNQPRARTDQQQRQVQQQQQQVTQSQQTHQARPVQQPTANAGPPQARGSENRGAPHETRAAPQGPAPQAQNRPAQHEARPAPPGPAPQAQNRPAPHEARPAPQGPAPQARAENPAGQGRGAENHGAEHEGKGAKEGRVKEDKKD